jgi:hypothetical protein
MPGISFSLFFPDGSPDGLRLLEKSNWTGYGVFCPRPVFAEAKSRDEFDRTGVYVLLGSSGQGVLPEVYIGQGDPIRPRLEQHQRNIDFWTAAICFTSMDTNLQTTHALYLESRLVGLAKAAKRCKLNNKNTPQLPTISEVGANYAEVFLAEMLLCFPVLGVTIFETAPEPTQTGTKLYFTAAGTSATGRESANGFVVLAGSTVREEVLDSMPASLRGLKKELIANGVISPGSAGLQFTQDYEFSSPSQAASLIQGASADGRKGWKDANGRTLKQIQEASAGAP